MFSHSDLKKLLLKEAEVKNSTGSIMVAINVPESPRHQFNKVLNNLERKNTLKRCSENLKKYKYPIGTVGTLTIAAITFAVLWSQYYTPLNHTFSELDRGRNALESNYTESNCPPDSYWHHPEANVHCVDGESISDDTNMLLTKEDYCLTGRSCTSPFAEQLINNLTADCNPIMKQICEVLGEIYDNRFLEMISGLLIIGIPAILCIGTIGGLYYMSKKMSPLSALEESEAKAILAERGVPPTEVHGHQYLTFISKFNAGDRILEDLSHQLENMPSGVFKIILQYMNLEYSEVIRLRKVSAKSRIQYELDNVDLDKENSLEITIGQGNSSDNNFLHRLFKSIPSASYSDPTLIKANELGYQRTNLDSASVAHKIMGYLG